MIYAAEPDAFGAEEVALLSELASDLAFGIGTLANQGRAGARAKRHCGKRKSTSGFFWIPPPKRSAASILEGNCTWVNRAAAQMLGYSDASSLLGKNLHGLAHYRLADGRPLPQDECKAYRAL